MSLLKTKPHYCKDAIATEMGWVNPVTKELLVSVRNLKSKLKIETRILNKAKKMENNEQPRVRKEYAPRKPKILGEVVEKPKMQLLGEVVEYDLEKPVLGE